MFRPQFALFGLTVALLFSACKEHQSPSTPPTQQIQISVTSDGFVASSSNVKVGEPVTLLVTRKVEKTCATDIVIKDYGVKQALPKDEVVKVTFTPDKPGPIRYACAMDMVSGQLIAE